MPSSSGTGATAPPSVSSPDPRASPHHRPGGGGAGGSPDSVLGAEREYLARSRDYLRLMRENVLGLRAMGGDPVSEEYLKADLYRRAEALRDIPDAPLFFGRLDYGAAAGEGASGVAGSDVAGSVVAGSVVAGSGVAPGGRAGAAAGPGAEVDAGQAVPGESLHIGRRHVHDREGHPVVIDWRAPVSRPFYRASQAEPMGLARRRRFGFSGGELTAFEDEEFQVPGGPRPGAPGQAQVSRILIEEIERPRSGPMRDIVATIQPDQDDIVRTDAVHTVCVQGAPGTGKTAVGLHRVAYLLYAYAGRMQRGGMLVIGPNQAFLSYIRNVLPALGEIDVTQVTIAGLVATVDVRATDSDLAARVKGDARMAQVLHRALWAAVTEPTEGLVLARGSRRWRVHEYEIAELIGELRERGVRYGAGRAMLEHRIAHVILTKMEAAGEPCDDRTHDAVRRTRQVRSVANTAWPAADPVRLVFRLLSDPRFLAQAADGILDQAEQQAIRWPAPPRGPRAARWSAADAVLVDEARDLIERTPSLAHVVVDEAQDLSPMECRAVGRRCTTGSATVLGDVAQATCPAAVADWPQILSHLGKPQAELRVLDVGYRVPRQILDYASRLLPLIAPGVSPARSLRQDEGAAAIVATKPGSLAAALTKACTDALLLPGSVAVIATEPQVREFSQVLGQAGVQHASIEDAGLDSRLTLVPVTLAKGLEFDHVIIPEPATIVTAHSRGLHYLYVALTRAVSRLTVLHEHPLPEPLRSLPARDHGIGAAGAIATHDHRR
jgi:UvrD-like helicase C-terminal domain